MQVDGVCPEERWTRSAARVKSIHVSGETVAYLNWGSWCELKKRKRCAESWGCLRNDRVKLHVQANGDDPVLEQGRGLGVPHPLRTNNQTEIPHRPRIVVATGWTCVTSTHAHRHVPQSGCSTKEWASEFFLRFPNTCNHALRFTISGHGARCAFDSVVFALFARFSFMEISMLRLMELHETCKCDVLCIPRGFLDRLMVEACGWARMARHRGFIKSVHHGDGGDMFETEGSQSWRIMVRWFSKKGFKKPETLLTNGSHCTRSQWKWNTIKSQPKSYYFREETKSITSVVSQRPQIRKNMHRVPPLRIILTLRATTKIQESWRVWSEETLQAKLRT